jgi:hypothetical protein
MKLSVPKFLLKDILNPLFRFPRIGEKIKISGAIYTRSNSPFASKYPILIKPSKIFRLMFEIQIHKIYFVENRWVANRR